MSEREGFALAIEQLHDGLVKHFEALHAIRGAAGRPVFALEHGLTDDRRRQLEGVVRGCVRLGVRPSRRNWLPFVVQAAEIGYRYEGEEYWHTFEDVLPGWHGRYDRSIVKTRFEEFARTYTGVRPRGPWARHFSIIAWPITHAILPTNLQRQLARILFDARGVLTSDLLGDAQLLGKVLAARSYYASKRFQQFAEDTELLGQVAMALLSDVPDQASILPATLDRIVEDLSAEREARLWLNAARTSAHKIRLRGVGPISTRTGPNRAHPHAVTAPVELIAEPSRGGWQLRVEVPDLTPLLERHPELATELGTIRCRVGAPTAPPQARGWLCYPGSIASIEAWPEPDTPVFILERPSPTLADRVSQEIRFPTSDAWLFKIGTDGTGRRVRSNVVQPGQPYLAVGKLDCSDLTPWMTEVPVQCADAVAVVLDVPVDAGSRDYAALKQLAGLSLLGTAMVEPAGLVPAAWDGQGYAEWFVGEKPLLRIAASNSVRSCAITLDGAQTELLTREEGADFYVMLSELDEGPHSVQFQLVSHDGASVPGGRLDVRIKQPQSQRGTGTARDPLRLRVWPPFASLEELWDGSATVQIEGPAGAVMKCSVELLDREGDRLQQRSWNIELPMSSGDWAAVFRKHCRNDQGFLEASDDASSLVLTLVSDEIGRVRHRFDREIEPLRWVYRHRGRQPSLRLRQSADSGGRIVVKYSPFASPYELRQIDNPEADLYTADGGLFEATLDEHSASIVVAQRVQDLHDLLPRVQLPTFERNPSVLGQLIGVARRWAGARTPGDLLSEKARAHVLRALLASISGLVGGQAWSSLETRRLAGSQLAKARWVDGLAKPGDWRQFVAGVLDLAQQASPIPPVSALATILGPEPAGSTVPVPEPAAAPRRIISSNPAASRVKLHRQDSPRPLSQSPVSRLPGNRVALAEFLLRLSSRPETLDPASPMVSHLLEVALRHPIVFRAARLLHVFAEEEGVEWDW